VTSPSPRRPVRTLVRAALAVTSWALLATMVAAGVGFVLGWRTYLVRSGSMGEAAPVGCLVLMHPIHAAEIKVGDVLLRQPAPGDTSLPVLHRVIERNETGGQVVVRTQGDRNPTPDPSPYVVRDGSLTMAAAIPGVGYGISVVRSRVGWWLFVVLPLTLLGLSWLRRLWRPTPARAPRATRPFRPPRRHRYARAGTRPRA
jgi:signal peptidase I